MKRIYCKSPFARHGRLTAIMSALLAFSACSSSFSESGEKKATESIKVMNWNLQTFFDASFDGNEYVEYKSSKSGWNREKYEARLDRLASVIKTLDADVIIMEEVEKEAQLQDISNRLSGTFDFSKIYSHAVFATNKGSSIGCAVLSRLPIGEISVHSMDVRTNEKQPSLRPIIEFSVYAKEKTLTIFVNHWKSKSGGAEISEIWRKRQEFTLSRLMKNACKRSHAVLAAGDFNKDILEFTAKYSDETANIVLHGECDFYVFSPWILKNGSYVETGSYWYKNAWERIDHFFAAGEAQIEDFCPETAGEWVDSEGHPFRYQIWNGKGYSDHLPITCTVRF